MRILVLEDAPERQHAFRKNLGDNHFIMCVCDARSAISMLEHSVWDWLFLDHDLSNEDAYGTGYQVACYLEEHPDRQPKHIVIHSTNIVGSARVAQALPRAFRFPFAWNWTFEAIEAAILMRGGPDPTYDPENCG